MVLRGDDVNISIEHQAINSNMILLDIQTLLLIINVKCLQMLQKTFNIAVLYKQFYPVNIFYTNVIWNCFAICALNLHNLLAL